MQFHHSEMKNILKKKNLSCFILNLTIFKTISEYQEPN